MRDGTQEKSLNKINENSIFYKIKMFFRTIFKKNNVSETKYIDIKTEKENNNDFMKNIKKIENEETRLLKLQKQYRSGEIKSEELTSEQIKALCDLYDKQIAQLRKSNEIRKQRLLEYRKNLQTEG